METQKLIEVGQKVKCQAGERNTLPGLDHVFTAEVCHYSNYTSGIFYLVKFKDSNNVNCIGLGQSKENVIRQKYPIEEDVVICVYVFIREKEQVVNEEFYPRLLQDMVKTISLESTTAKVH